MAQEKILIVISRGESASQTKVSKLNEFGDILDEWTTYTHIEDLQQLLDMVTDAPVTDLR